MNPATDSRLNPGEKALYTRIYPLIEQIESELDADITLLVLHNMIRRAVSRGADIPAVIAELSVAARHQEDFNAAHERAMH